MDNDATAAALGEHWRGAGASNFVYLYLGRGLGAGLIVDGQAFRGRRGNAGEISHVQVDPEGPPCGCGSNGCLGLYATPEGVALAGLDAAAGHLAKVVEDLTQIIDPELMTWAEQHYRKVRSYLDGIEADGGTIRTGGLGDGWVVLPTVVENAPPAARICREEVFGPVVTIASFDDDEDAIRSANDTRYGLNAMVFTRDLSRAHRASAALRAGTVWVNCFFVRDLRAPFGGVGDSGIGREGGTFSREFFTEPKAVVMQV